MYFLASKLLCTCRFQFAFLKRPVVLCNSLVNNLQLRFIHNFRRKTPNFKMLFLLFTEHSSMLVYLRCPLKYRRSYLGIQNLEILEKFLEKSRKTRPNIYFTGPLFRRPSYRSAHPNVSNADCCTTLRQLHHLRAYSESHNSVIHLEKRVHRDETAQTD